MTRLRDQEQSVAVDTTDPTNIYVGFADTGSAAASAVWQIKKIVIVGSDISIKYANGRMTFDSVWDNRAALSYS